MILKTIAVIGLAVGTLATAPSHEVARFFKKDTQTAVVTTKVDNLPPSSQTPLTAHRAQAQKASTTTQEPAPQPAPAVEPAKCNENQWVRADNGGCIDKPQAVEQAIPTVNEPAPAAVASAGSGGCDLAYNYSDWPAATARAICMAESTNNPNAVNWGDHHGQCSGSFSLMQVGCFWYPYYGYSSADYYNGSVNMEIAHKIWAKQGGFGAWTTYTSGKYLRFM